MARCCWPIRSMIRPRQCCWGLAVVRGPVDRRHASVRSALVPAAAGVRRSVTHAACRELGLTAWQDPHNTDRRFTRTRLRTDVLPLLEDVLGGGVAEALARTATALREDTDLIDTIAAQALPGAAVAGSRGQELSTSALTALPDAVRRRVIRGWLLAGGATGLTDRQIRGVDRLVTAWRGQGGVAVGSTLRGQRLVAGRRDGVLVLRREPV